MNHRYDAALQQVSPSGRLIEDGHEMEPEMTHYTTKRYEWQAFLERHPAASSIMVQADELRAMEQYNRECNELQERIIALEQRLKDLEHGFTHSVPGNHDFGTLQKRVSKLELAELRHAPIGPSPTLSETFAKIIADQRAVAAKDWQETQRLAALGRQVEAMPVECWLFHRDRNLWDLSGAIIQSVAHNTPAEALTAAGIGVETDTPADAPEVTP